jgi:type VI secretion system secreted protein VgrG
MCDQNHKISASGAKLKQQCVSQALRGYDEAAGYESTIKAEVPYRMVPPPPQPIMSKSNPKRATGSKPAGSRIPDVVLVKDGSRQPTQDNIAEIVEIKFPGDSYSENQLKDYQKIAGLDAEVKTFGVDDPCNCNKREPEPVPVPVPVPAPAPERKTGPQAVPATGIAAGLAALALLLLAAAEEAAPYALAALAF